MPSSRSSLVQYRVCSAAESSKHIPESRFAQAASPFIEPTEWRAIPCLSLGLASVADRQQVWGFSASAQCHGRHACDLDGARTAVGL
ncbi:hypothetical protein CW304_33035 [Bacillus sp. UFRGS-B20]|nr:hypothetical protein CW304_33035 [Bacillus sp. UFRGS-B20]